MKSYTDIEQSKKLAEILPVESADMFHFINDVDTVGFGYKKDAEEFYSKTEFEYIPCWSLAALMKLLPSEFTEKGIYSETTYKIDIRKYKLIDGVDLYQIAYGNYKFYEDGNCSWKDMINSGEKEYLLDAVFQMICWLKENGKI